MIVTMNSQEIKAEYTSSLTDLTFNSKPLINMLTMLAEENVAQAVYIVEAIEEHLDKVQTNVKLPILYLIDCIAKNIGQTYTSLFSHNIVKTFCSVFKVVDEETRAEMFKLRQTWNNIFPQTKLYAIDVQIRMLDPAWPVTAQPNSIHFNPKFLKNPKADVPPAVPDPKTASPLDMETFTMQQKLMQKQRELLELQQKKLKLELLQTQVKLQKQFETNSNVPVPNSLPSKSQNILLKPEVAKQLMPESAKQKSKSNTSLVTKIPQSVPRIAPVNSALATASRPIRDPRLLRQQQDKGTNGTNVTKSPKIKKPEIDGVKSKSPKKPERSPIKLKKKESLSSDKKSSKEAKRHKSDDSSDFKGVKSKNRNYIRKTRSPSFSPEPSHDTDLRMVGPPEKQPRLQSSDSSESLVVGKQGPGKDMDFRQMNDTVKKRPSSEIDGTSTKKSKSEVLDALFGNEDVDLRTVLQPERPPTPPPPIISYTETEKHSPKKSTDLDAVRAKLANATGRDKIMAKCFRKKRPQKEDEDLRVASNDSVKKIIISSNDQQCIQDGTMTKEQEKTLMNKIIAQIEQQKLQEAQMKEETSVSNLQPVSDEELEDSEEKFGDKDDRVNYPKFGRRGGGFWRGTKRRHWENNHAMGSRPPMRPWSHQVNPWRPMGPTQRTNDSNMESTDELTVESVSQDDIKTICIDKIPREIRYYDETSVIFLNWDDPREISFQDGTRRVIFDDRDVCLLNFNDPYKECCINGVMHRVKLGSPTRELFIDGKPYECYFGSGGITIELDGKMTMVKLEQPPPDVRIGTEKRTDLVAGKVNLIIDAKILVPVFLDAKVQKFVVNGETHTLKFVDALKTVLINDVPFKVEFGGLPKPITVHDKKHFIRFSVLPKGIKPGFVRIKNMDGEAAEVDENSQDEIIPTMTFKNPEQNLMQQNNLDLLSSVMTSSMATTNNNGGYQIETPTKEKPIVPTTIVTPTPALPPSLNINELFQKLVATGIVATKEPQIEIHPPKPRRRPMEPQKRATFHHPETLKLRHSALYDSLYSGMQCSSCGMRFSPDQSMRYSQHLDWHFRQNRKGKRNIRVGATRRWFYSLSDWMNYVEVEDLEERENYFDQQSQAENAAEEHEEDVEIPSVPADSEEQETQCEVCQDKFDQFFNEDKEEWHLRNAIRVDEKTYHPLCYEDYQASLVNQSKESVHEEEEEEKPQTPQNIPGLEIILDDDDDTPSEVIIEESDEEVVNEVVEEKQEEEQQKQEEEDDDDDDDVIIHEVVPEKIEVDDDKEYESLPVAFPIKIEHIDDGFMDVEEGLRKIKNGGDIQIKSEPMDLDDVCLSRPIEDPIMPTVTEPSQPTLTSSIDGNTEPLTTIPAPTSNVGSKIRINISKPLPVITPRENRDIVCESVSLDPIIDPSQPLPPGEEPVQLNIKPALRGIELKKMPPVQKGSELTGMCSIM